MDEQTENQPQADPTENQPHSVRTRKGDRGPGHIVAVLASKADADLAASIVGETAEKGQTVFTKVYNAPVIVSIDDFKAERDALAVAASAATAARAKLNAADLAALGLS